MSENFGDKLSGLGNEAVEQYGDQIGEGAERAGDFADERTDGRFGDQIDRGVEQVQERVSGSDASSEGSTESEGGFGQESGRSSGDQAEAGSESSAAEDQPFGYRSQGEAFDESDDQLSSGQPEQASGFGE